MMLLASTSDEIRLTTDAAATIDVHASYVDGVSSFTPGRKNTAISTATTTTVVASPGSGVYRTVKTLEIRNRDTVAVGVTVIHRASGPTDSQLIYVMLPEGSALTYDEQLGWEVRRASTLRRRIYAPPDGPAIGTLYAHVLPYDVSSSADTVANNLKQARELAFYAIAGQTYWFEFILPYAADAAGNGGRFVLQGPGLGVAASFFGLRYHTEISTGTTTKSLDEGQSTFEAIANSNNNSASADANWARLEGYFNGGADGLVHLGYASEGAGTTSFITVKAGALVRYRRVL